MSTFIRAGRRTRDAVRSWIFIAGLAVWAAAVPAGAADGVGLYRDGQLVEQLLPASALVADGASSAVARDPQAFARMMAGELATEALGGELRPETVARNAALREAAAPLAALRETVRTMREGGVAERTAGRAVLRAQASALADSWATTRRVMDEIGAQIAQARLPQEIAARHQRSVAEAARGHAALRGALDAYEAGDEAALAQLDTLLGELAGPAPDLAKLGPTVQPETLRPAPALSRAEADALLETSAKAAAVAAKEDPIELASSPPVAADLAATIEVQLTPEIVAEAASLGNSPLAIYEFVRNQIAFQPYLGSRKGAVETLHQRAGNDTDQASLLLALLRAAGIPSRYVRGTVEMTPARASSWLGVDDAATAGSILTTAGMDGLNIVDGSTVTAVRCTRVWVEAYVPYAQYRGAAGSSLGSAWVPLDPAFTGSVVTPGQDVLAAMAFNTDAFLTSYISTFHALSPVEQFVANIQTYLDGAQPGTTVAQIERRTAIAPQALGLLPASVPNEVRTVASRFSELEDAKRYKVRFRLYNGATTFVDHTINLSQLAGHRLTIDYVGATPADQATIDSFGGVYQTPPNLVNVKPRLKLDGAVLAASTNTIGLARTHNSDMHFLHPTGASNVQPLVQNTITAGNSQAIGFDTFLDAGDGAIFPSTLPTPGFLETLLEDTAGEYLSRVDRGMEQVGRIMRVTTTQDVSEAIVESAVRVAYSFGVPVTFEWTGLIVDADRRIVGTFPVNGDNSKNVPFMKLTGYDGSTMENRVFEDLYGQRAVSTIKILELSSDAGIPVFTIVTSIAADAPGLSQPASVVSAINTALSQGHRVIVPRTGITIGGWSGTGYIDLTPSTGAAGYIISGGISGNVVASGGATVDVWPINLGCAPIGPVTGTITPVSFTDGEKLCPDAGQITYSVQLAYDCKDSSGATVHKTFGPTSHTVPKTKLQIVEGFGAGLYTISIPGTAVAPVTFTLVDVESLKPDKGTEIDDGDGDANTKSYYVPISKTAGDKVTVTAVSKPPLAEADLPACWSLTGGTGTGKLSRTVDQTAAAKTILVAQSGLRKKTTTVFVFKIELITPAGDPVAAPVNAGDGQNEFTFSAAASGVLTMNLKAKVTPAGVAAKIADKSLFTAGAIGASVLAWDAANPGGKSTASGDDLLATVKFTGLPAASTDFGKKKASVAFDGAKQDEKDYEVFFPRDATNHPGGTTPNWFFYWLQARPNAAVKRDAASGNSGYAPGILNWTYGAAPDKTGIFIGSPHPGKFGSYTTGTVYSGIDRFHATVIHEEKHIAQIAAADPLVPSAGADSFRYGWSWNAATHNHWTKGADGKWGVATVDDDANGTVDDAKTSPPFEPGNGDDVSLEHPAWSMWPNAWPLPVPNGDGHPVESEAVNHSNASITEHDYAAKDWGNPGKQHETLNKWDD